MWCTFIIRVHPRWRIVSQATLLCLCRVAKAKGKPLYVIPPDIRIYNALVDAGKVSMWADELQGIGCTHVRQVNGLIVATQLPGSCRSSHRCLHKCSCMVRTWVVCYDVLQWCGDAVLCVSIHCSGMVRDSELYAMMRCSGMVRDALFRL